MGVEAATLAGKGRAERRNLLSYGHRNPLRLAILAGLDVVVDTAGGLEPVAREAACVAGRLADLRVVHDTALTDLVRVRPTSLRSARTRHPALADVPLADPAEGAGILVVRSEDHTGHDGGAFSEYLAAALRARRGRRGSHSGPVLFTDRRPDPYGQGEGRALWGLDRLHVHRGEDDWASYTPGADAGLATDADWAAAVARRDWAGGASVARLPGLACIQDGRRGVVAALGDGGPLDLYVIDEYGWIWGMRVTFAMPANIPLVELAEILWCGGVGAVQARFGRRWSGRLIRHPALRLREDHPEALPLVRCLVDMPFLLSRTGGPWDHAVARMLSRREGDHRARRDFALTWPAFARHLLEPGFAAEVDAGGETLPLVAGRIGVSQAVARRLVGRRTMPDCHLMGMPGDDPASALRAFLEEIGHDRLPAQGDVEGWSGLCHGAEVTAGLLARAEATGPSPGAWARMLLACGRDWPSRILAIDAAAGTDEAGTGDFVAAFAAWLGDLSGRPVEPSRALAMLAGDGSYLRLAERSHRWHRGGPSRHGIPDTVTWPVPFRRVDLGGGWHAACLDGPRALRDEGADGPDGDGIDGLRHCVGEYVQRCWSGKSLILSLRVEEGGAVRRASTVELYPEPTGKFDLSGHRFEVAQHFGRSNGPPCAEAMLALDRLRAMLADGLVPVDAGAFAERPELPPGTAMRDGALANLDAWRGLMPRALAALDVEALAAMATARGDGDGTEG